MKRWISAVILGCVVAVLAPAMGVAAGAEMPPHTDTTSGASGLTYDEEAKSVSFEGALHAEANAVGPRLAAPVEAGIYETQRSIVAPRTGGTTLVADDAVSIRVADRAPVAPGQHNVVLHGDANGFVGSSVDNVAAAVRADPAYGGQPICLLSCNSASNGSAQALATQLDVPVQAPTGLVGVPRPPAAPQVVLGPGSEWVWFYPGGP